jgi:hypothetical protein
MTRRLFRTVATAILVVASTATGGVRPQPAQAVPVTFDLGTAAVAIAVSLFGGSGGSQAAIEAAKREILDAINRSTREILDHTERLAIEELGACIDTATRDLVNMDGFPIDSQINFATHISECADLSGRYLDAVLNESHANSLGFYVHVIFPSAIAARAKAGIPNDQLLATYIAANDRIISRVVPNCFERYYDDPSVPGTTYGYWEYRCTAPDGTVATARQRIGDGPTDPPYDYERVQREAMRDTSRPLAISAGPLLRETLGKVKQGFVFTTVQSGKVKQWNTAGPHFWSTVGNAGTATAVASTLDVNSSNQRHVVAVLDGKVHHRSRKQDGSLTAWGSIGDHPGTATAVAAAADSRGRTHVAAIIDGQTYHRLRLPDGSWQPWGRLGNPGHATALAGVVDLAGRLHLAAVIDGKVWHRIRKEDASWSPFAIRDHPGTATAVAVADDLSGNHRIHLVAVVDGQVQHRIRMDEQSWTNWGRLGNPGSATGLAAASDPNNSLQVALIVDSQVYQRTRAQDGRWNGPARDGESPWALVERQPFDSFGTAAISAS